MLPKKKERILFLHYLSAEYSNLQWLSSPSLSLSLYLFLSLSLSFSLSLSLCHSLSLSFSVTLSLSLSIYLYFSLSPSLLLPLSVFFNFVAPLILSPSALKKEEVAEAYVRLTVKDHNYFWFNELIGIYQVQSTGSYAIFVIFLFLQFACGDI